MRQNSKTACTATPAQRRFGFRKSVDYKAPTQNERGTAMVEFALILPLLFVITLSTIEFSQIFRLREFQALVTKEAGSIVYRYCFEKEGETCETREIFGYPDSQTQQRLEACLDQWNGVIDGYVSSVLDGVTLTISFYRLPPGSNFIERMAITTRSGSQEVETKSKYWNNIAKLRDDYEQMLRGHEVIAIAEVFVLYPFTLIDVFQPELELYHATAY